MQNLGDELKVIRDSENKQIPTLEELEAHILKATEPNYTKTMPERSFVSRLLPDCYTTFNFNNLNVKNFHEETLFFIYYAFPDSDLQLKAFNELINRGFLYSKTLEYFIILNEPKLADNKKKAVMAFIPREWEKMTTEVLFDNEFIEGLESVVNE